MAPQPMQRHVGALADGVPQRDVERRHRHGDDAAAVVGDGALPEIVPDALDRGGVLADHVRQDGLLQRRDDGLQARPEREQVAHADDAALGLDLEHQEIARVAEGVALEPRRVRPRHAQHGGADGLDGHVGHVNVLSDSVECRFDAFIIARHAGDKSTGMQALREAREALRDHPGFARPQAGVLVAAQRAARMSGGTSGKNVATAVANSSAGLA